VSTVTADAMDPDGDALTYRWGAPAGRLSNPADRQTLWTAGQQKNWELAGYELELVKSSLNEAIALYTDIPVENITMIDPPIKSIESAIAARNSAAFGKAFGDLTTGCNSCHQSVRRGFIVMTVPTASPFGKYLRAVTSLMTATSGAPARSLGWNVRPARTRTLSAPK